MRVLARTKALVHSLTIVRLFGVRTYVRCLRAAFGTVPTTFLPIVFVHARPPSVAAAERSRAANRSLTAYPGT